jgi:16S rRNA (guanine1207-N2)-methyltransferase
VRSDPFKALALAISPDDAALMIGGDAWPAAVDRRNPKLPPWPEASRKYSTVAVRLPKARDELAMLLHAGAAVLKPDASLYLFGGNDEGIGSAAKPLHGLFAEIETAAIKHHARVYCAHDLKADAVLRGRVEDWRSEFSFESGGQTFRHVTYPGVFARDRLDAGTAVLLEHLPPITGRVLDFGAGSGPIAQVIRALHPDCEIAMADIDAIALLAAAENVPDARTVQVRGVADLAGGAFDLIVSNPPLHAGIAQDFAMLRDLIAARSTLLRSNGRMFLVVQSKVPLQRLAPDAAKVATRDGYAVWSL